MEPHTLAHTLSSSIDRSSSSQGRREGDSCEGRWWKREVKREREEDAGTTEGRWLAPLFPRPPLPLPRHIASIFDMIAKLASSALATVAPDDGVLRWWRARVGNQTPTGEELAETPATERAA